jgi:hypothetical protein
MRQAFRSLATTWKWEKPSRGRDKTRKRKTKIDAMSPKYEGRKGVAERARMDDDAALVYVVLNKRAGCFDG